MLPNPKETTIETFKNMEASILKVLKKEIEGLIEVYKRVMAEGVKNGIVKIGNLFGHLVTNRSEKIAFRQSQIAQKGAEEEVPHNLDALRKDIIS